MSAIDSQRVVFQRGLAASEISNKGFANVSIIEGNREALGHGIYIDEKGLGQLMGLLMGKSLPAYITHDGAIFSDRLTEEIGMFSGFYREGNKIKATKFSFFESFRKHESEEFDKLVELAEKMPDQMGVSIVFGGTAVWVDAEGNESPGYLPEPDGAQFGMPVVRFSSIESADFVKNPAANDGLFSIKKAEVDGSEKDMATTITLDAHKEALAAKDAELESIKGQLSAKDSELTALAEKHAGEIETLKGEHEAAFASAKTELEEAKKKAEELEQFDSRKLGVKPAEVAPEGGVKKLPEPAKNDKERWDQYSELASTDKDAAEAFREKYLSHNFRIKNL